MNLLAYGMIYYVSIEVVRPLMEYLWNFRNDRKIVVVKAIK